MVCLGEISIFSTIAHTHTHTHTHPMAENDYRYALRIASEEGRLDDVKTLTESGVNANAADEV